MTEAEPKLRTRNFALRVMKLVDALPMSIKGRAIAGLLIRSGTSVAANYRSSCRARSKAEFVAKLGLVAEEADESVLWLQLIIEDGLLPEKRVTPLLTEANEIDCITVSSRRTASGLFNRKSSIENRK